METKIGKYAPVTREQIARNHEGFEEAPWRQQELWQVSLSCLCFPPERLQPVEIVIREDDLKHDQ